MVTFGKTGTPFSLDSLSFSFILPAQPTKEDKLGSSIIPYPVDRVSLNALTC